MSRAGDAYTNMLPDDKATMHDLQEEREMERYVERMKLKPKGIAAMPTLAARRSTAPRRTTSRK